jgi:hypothetical protein
MTLHTSISVLAMDGGGVNSGVNVKIETITILEAHRQSRFTMASEAGLITNGG